MEPAHRTIVHARTMRPGIPSVSSATFWPLISSAHGLTRNDRAAPINREFCIVRYRISSADRSRRNHKLSLYHAIVMMLCVLANNNGIVIMRHNGIVMMHHHAIVMMTIEDDSHCQGKYKRTTVQAYYYAPMSIQRHRDTVMMVIENDSHYQG